MYKKEFTSFDVAATLHELGKTIINSRVANVYQLNSETLLLKLRGKGEAAFVLVLEAGKRLHLTSYVCNKPLIPPAFCMALRKYLRGSWLTHVEQYEFERVVILRFKSKIGVLGLVLELFGEGNLILVDGENKILQALRYKRMRDRNILKGEVMRFAPSSGQNPIKVSKQEFSESLRNFGDAEVVRVLARFFGVGGVYAEEILLRLGIEKTTRCGELNTIQVEAIYGNLQGLISQVIDGKLEAYIVLDDMGNFVDVTPLRLKRYEGMKKEFYSSFNIALDEFYSRVALLEKTVFVEKEEELRREAERIRRVIAEQEKTLKEAEMRAEKYRKIGDAIYIHSAELQALLEKFLEGKRLRKDWDKIVSEILTGKRLGSKPDIFFESFNKQKQIVGVCIDDLNFELDLKKDLFANASQFYENAKVAQRKFEGAKAALEDSRKRLEEAEVKLKEAEVEGLAIQVAAIKELANRKLKEKKWFEKFRWFKSSDGFLVVGGKDAISNEVLIKKYTEPEDIVFHADIAGAPFVVIKTEGKEPGETCLKEAGEMAAAFSRGWREGFASVDVYWVKPEQLSKAGGSGEYVPRGAFVVRGKPNWMRNTPLRLAIGLVEGENGKVAFIGGAVDAVKAKTKAYCILVPGNFSGKELLTRILKVIAGKTSKERRKEVLATSVENIRDFVPYGKGNILNE